MALECKGEKVADVKKNIETVQGPVVYPAAQQVLIHNGKILKDEKTLEENKVAANSSVMVVISASGSSTTSVAPANVVSAQPKNSIAPSTQPSPASHFAHSKPVTESIHAPVSVPVLSTSSSTVTNLHGQAESCKAVGTDVESNIQHLLYLGRGKWDREMCNLEEYEIPPEARTPAPAFAFTHQPVAASSGPKAAPLDLFPQRASNVDSEARARIIESLRNSDRRASNVDSEARARIIESLRNSDRFQTFRTTVQANPHRLLPMIQDLSKVHPGLLRVIYENWIDFLRLLTEPVKREGNVPRQLAESMPTESMSIAQEEYEAMQTESMSITPEDSEAIKRVSLPTLYL
ncbi:ubiquitin receptor RAD23d-like protein isoform X1 [Tanacetum coccineum]